MTGRRIILLVAAVLLGVWFWRDGVRYNVMPKNFGVVDEGRVYRSGQLKPAAMRTVVERKRIKTEIDLGAYWAAEQCNDPRGEERNQQVADALGVTRYVMPLYGDGTGNPNWYIHALRVMSDPANQPVLVHCGAGSERTTVLSVLYEQLHTGKPTNAEGVEAARAFKHRPERTPQVRGMLDTWGPAILRHVRDGGQIAEFPAIETPKPKNAASAP